MADGNVAGATGEMGAAATADHVCRDGHRTAVGSLDLLALLAEGGAGDRQAAIAARAAGSDVEAELRRVTAAGRRAA